MKLLIIGATGATGKHLVNQALERGEHVTALARNPATLTISHPNLTIVKADILDPESIKHALSSAKAVISVLGNKTSTSLFKATNVISRGLPNVISAMQQSGAKRLVYVSSFGINENIFWPEKLLLRTLLKNLFVDLPAQENLIKESGLNWTIVRPARLTNGPRTGNYRSGENIYIHPFSSISREDVAAFLLKEVASSEYEKMVITVSRDVAQSPTLSLRNS